MNKINIKLGIIACSALAILGCGKDETVVRVSSACLTEKALEKDVEAIFNVQKAQIPTNHYEEAKQMFRNQVAQSFLVENVLFQKAVKEGFSATDEEFKARADEFVKSMSNTPDAPKTIEEAAEKSPLGKERALDQFKKGIVIEKYLKDVEAKSIPVSPETVAKAEEIIANIISNNQEASQGEAKFLQRITALKEQLDKITDPKAQKEKFAELAKQNSDCPSKNKGGDLDFFTPGMMVPEFDKAAFSLDVGKISEPVKTKFGYHLILVTDKKPAVEAKGETPASPASVRASHILVRIPEVREVPTKEVVINALSRDSKRQFMMGFIEKAIKEADVEVSEEFKQLLPAEEPAAAVEVAPAAEKKEAPAAEDAKKEAKEEVKVEK